MENRFRVLCIAPYEGMKSLMSNLAEEYPQMDLTLFVGDRELGPEIARANFHGNYDVVISRGGTAAMLRRDLSLPVVEIEVTMYDLLCALRLANGLDGQTSFIAAPNIAESARRLCEVMGDGMDIYTYDADNQVEPILLELQRGHCQTVLCDTLANTTAKRLGMNSFLITSSLDSLRKAFDQALLLCRSRQRLRDENLFFRELIQGQISQTVVFDCRGGLVLSTLSDPAPELLELLRQELPESRRSPERRITRNLGGMLYAIRIKQVDWKCLLHGLLRGRPVDPPLSQSDGYSFLQPPGGGERVLRQHFQLRRHHRGFSGGNRPHQPEQRPGHGHRRGWHRQRIHGKRPIPPQRASKQPPGVHQL